MGCNLIMIVISSLCNYKLAYSLLDLLEIFLFFQTILYFNQIDHAYSDENITIIHKSFSYVLLHNYVQYTNI